MKLALLTLLFFPLSIVASEQPLRYHCDNGTVLDISFFADSSGRPQATLHFVDQNVTLPSVPSASGALYRAGDVRLHTKGDEAIFDDSRGNLRRCSRQIPPQPTPKADPASSTFIEIRGNVTYRTRLALPPGALLTLVVRDAARAKTPSVLIEQQYELNDAQVPIPFSLLVDRDLIGKKSRLTVSARIETGKRLRFVSEKPMVVTAPGEPLEIVLKTVRSTPH